MIYKFHSTDLGAPTLSGTVGAMTALLQAVLVDGYGSVAVSSITRSGSTVTVETSGAHGLQAGAEASVAQISGADQTDYNGKWLVTSVPDSTHYTFDIGSLTPATPATGSISSKRAGMGWTMPFSGTNKAVFRMPTSSNGHYLRVDDNSPSGGDAKCLAVRGFESMTDVDNGSGAFPTTSQQSNGLGWIKSAAASSEARPWVVFGDGELFWIGVAYSSTSYYSFNAFGKAASFKAGDAYDTFLIGGPVSTTASTVASNGLHTVASSLSNASSWYIARLYNQLGSAQTIGMHGDDSVSGTLGGGGMTYPSPVDNGLYVARLRLSDPSVSLLRGVLPGILQPLHNQPLASGDLVSDIVGLPGVTLQAWRLVTYTAGFQLMIDLTGPWR